MRLNSFESGDLILILLATVVISYILYMFIRAGKSLNRAPSENVKELTDHNFRSIVNSGISLVDFWAAWCGPCRIQGPIIDDVADELKSKANVCKIDIDKHNRIASEFGVQSIPTILLFKDGKVIERFTGIKTKRALLSAVNSII